MKKTARLLMILAVGGAIFWAGGNLGPGRNKAEAKVFEKLLLFSKSMPGYLNDDAPGRKPVKAIVNGNTTYLTMRWTTDDISRIMDFYEKAYPPLDIEKVDAADLSRLKPEVQGQIQKAYRFLEFLKRGQNFRFEGDDFGFFGAFEFRNRSQKSGSPEFYDAFGKSLESGRIGDVGTGRMVIAFKNETSRDTAVVTVWTDRDFNVRNFMPDAHGDIPGKDIEDVPRYPGALRQLSVEQENSKTLDHLVIYEGDGSVVNNLLFYHSRMKASGWVSDLQFAEVMKKHHHESFLFFTRKGRECTIHINQDPDSGRILTTAMERRTIHT